MYYYLVAIYFVVLFIATSLVFFPLALILRLVSFRFDRRLAALHLLSTVWASCYTWFCPLWSVSISGRENVDRKKAYMMVCNHQSMLDIPIIYRVFLHFKWVAKASLFRVPIIGWNLRLNRCIRIERSSGKSQREMLRQCVENIKNGSSIMIFPEGTRSRNGELRASKEGAFLIALQPKTDVLPIVLDNSYQALPEKGIIPKRKQKVCLHILQPVPYETFKTMSVRQLSQHIHGVIADELERMRH
jgi:1-acyl-sn-glycerol-3-phosphate acyltransferase